MEVYYTGNARAARVYDAGLTDFEEKFLAVYEAMHLSRFASPALIRPHIDKIFLFPTHLWNWKGGR